MKSAGFAGFGMCGLSQDNRTDFADAAACSPAARGLARVGSVGEVVGSQPSISSGSAGAHSHAVQ
eukprot:scaffold117973_cov21-Tisochrysis_lutea.AAC.3